MYPNFARGQLLARLLPDYVVTAKNALHSGWNTLKCPPFWISKDFSRGVAQPGSARRSGRRGREFEPHHPDHFST